MSLKINFTIDDSDSKKYITNIANKASISVDEYAKNIVENWIKGQLKSMYINYVKNKDFDYLKNKFDDVSLDDINT